jgi:hypothetical protein
LLLLQHRELVTLLQRGQPQSFSNNPTVFCASGVRKEVAAVLDQVVQTSQKLGKTPDETMAAVAHSRAAQKLMPETASALVNLGNESKTNEPVPLSPSAPPTTSAVCLSPLLAAC